MIQATVTLALATSATDSTPSATKLDGNEAALPGSFTTGGLYVANTFGYSVQISSSGAGAPVGQYRIQASNDPAVAHNGMFINSDSSVTHWTDVATEDVSTGVVSVWHAFDASAGAFSSIAQANGRYRFIRLDYQATGGTFVPLVRVQSKGHAG